MKTRLLPVLIGIMMAIIAGAQTTTTIFYDDFDGTAMRTDLWHIPTWVSSTDGTYVGRTQFRCSQNSGLPAISNGEAIIVLETYNPTGFSFYGTDLITNRSFSLGEGLVFTIRAKFISPLPRGIVGGIFLYDIVGVPPYHDEIDFEMVSNRTTEVQTNIYDNEPLGAGHPAFHPITGSVTDYHTYVIKWLPGEISWLVDGVTIRTITTLIPERSMHFHLNIWAPDAGWAEGFDGNLQPVAQAGLNSVYSMAVDYVKVESLGTVSVTENTDSQVKIYPNPSHDYIYLDSPDITCVRIYNITGNLVLSTGDLSNGILPVSGLASGIYSLQYMRNGIWRSYRVVKY